MTITRQTRSRITGGSDLVSDRVLQDSSAVQSRFPGGERLPRRRATSIPFSSSSNSSSARTAPTNFKTCYEKPDPHSHSRRSLAPATLTARTRSSTSSPLCPIYGALAREIGGDKVDVTVLAKPTEDPHFVDARPSFVVQLRSADVLIDGGAELEIGWLPPLLQNARNPKIEVGQTGTRRRHRKACG